MKKPHVVALRGTNHVWAGALALDLAGDPNYRPKVVPVRNAAQLFALVNEDTRDEDAFGNIQVISPESRRVVVAEYFWIGDPALETIVGVLCQRHPLVVLLVPPDWRPPAHWKHGTRLFDVPRAIPDIESEV